MKASFLFTHHLLAQQMVKLFQVFWCLNCRNKNRYVHLPSQKPSFAETKSLSRCWVQHVAIPKLYGSEIATYEGKSLRDRFCEMPEEEARGLLKDDGTTPPSSCNACCILRGVLCFVLVLALLGGAGAGFIMSVLARCQAASFFLCVCFPTGKMECSGEPGTS